MSQPSVSAIPADVRTRLADQLDEVVRQLQVAQSVLRAELPTVPLATLSTGLIGALITTREVSDAVGMAEGANIGAGIHWTPAPEKLRAYDHLDVADV